MLDLNRGSEASIISPSSQQGGQGLTVSDMESITALKQGTPLAPQKLIEMRSKGMHTVRFEFIVRLLRLNTQIITLSIYWEDGREFMQIPASQNVQRKLVYASEPRVSGFFDDISLLCYPLDPDAKAKVDAELDRMVAAIGEYGLRVARP